jgi:calcineurin-like phosphoesterase family protein
MPAVWLTSDTHFGHTGVCRYVKPDGAKLRPWTDPEEMDEAMVKLWNDRVKPNDRVYHLGDVVINKQHLSILDRLNGEKILIRGNHDIFPDHEYHEYFRDLKAYHVMPGIIFSHIPIYSEGMDRFTINIHGHLHSNRVHKIKGVDTKTDKLIYSDEIDPRYHCVCVEQTGFAPILFDDVRQRILAEGAIMTRLDGNYDIEQES